jgi:hypothetical protein
MLSNGFTPPDRRTHAGHCRALCPGLQAGRVSPGRIGEALQRREMRLANLRIE